MKQHLLAGLLLAGAGCWQHNTDYQPPPHIDMLAAPDLNGCASDPPDGGGGGGGMNRPEVLVPPGTFNMQGTMLTMTPYYLDEYLVTVQAYRDCYANGTGTCSRPAGVNSNFEKADAGPNDSPYCTWTDAAQGMENHPINCITWQQAHDFCTWAGRRLPNEAELQYAMGGPTPSATYPWGNSDPQQNDKPARLCWSYTSNNATCPVGSYEKTLRGKQDCNGAFDLAGDVWVWSNSEYKDPYVTPEQTCTDNCSLRGGSWDLGSFGYFQAADRFNVVPTIVDYGDGARCARTP